MNDKNRETDQSDVESTPEWHPYSVWQQRIRDAKPDDSNGREANVTGSWRTDAVWQNLIKG